MAVYVLLKRLVVMGKTCCLIQKQNQVHEQLICLKNGYYLKKSLAIYKRRKRKNRSYENLDLVVCTEFGTPTHKSNIRRVFKSIIKKAEVPKIRFHDMRHTHATLLLLQGVNPKIVSERLGHADVRITLDTYSHLLPSMQKDTAIKFGEMLFGEDGKYRIEINLD
ncbi:site-specific integrase [Bacillus cereus group sp. Bce002]